MSPLEVSLLRPPYCSGDACLGGGLSANAGTCSSQPMGLGHGSVFAPQELPSLSLSWAETLLLLPSTVTAKP